MGVPKVTRTRYPPSRSAKPPARRTPTWGPGSTGVQPAGRRGFHSGGGSPEVTQLVPRGEEHPSARPRAGLPVYLAGSCAPCCPSLLRGAASAAARSGRTEANCAGGRGPGRGRAAGHRGCTGEPAGGSWGDRGEGGGGGGGRRRRSHRPGPASSALAARRLQPRGREGPRPPHLLKVCTGWREPNRRTPALTVPARPGQEDAPGSWVPPGCRACRPAGLSLV